LYTYPPEFQAQKVNKCLILYRRKEDKRLKKKQKKAGTALNGLIVTPSNNTNKLELTLYDSRREFLPYKSPPHLPLFPCCSSP
jgi:hypothetical protein